MSLYDISCPVGTLVETVSFGHIHTKKSKRANFSSLASYETCIPRSET